MKPYCEWNKCKKDGVVKVPTFMSWGWFCSKHFAAYGKLEKKKWESLKTDLTELRGKPLDINAFLAGAEKAGEILRKKEF